MTAPLTTPPLTIAFLGLGTMGGPMARHLGKAGHRLTIFNRSDARREAWMAANPGLAARVAASPAEAAQDADAVITCVGNDDDLADVVLSPNGAFTTLRPGAVFIDHTTVSARIARQIAVEGRDKEILCVDAPVSGGQSGAENGVLSIMCGGSDKAMAAARPILSAYAKRIVHVGKPGAGQTTKMVNQMCLSATIAGLSEAMRFAQAAHLDLDRVFEAISGGAAQSWQMDNRWDTMAKGEFDFGFAIDWMRKDLGLAIEEARGLGASVPTTALTDQFYADVQALGGGRQDTSALIRRLPCAARSPREAASDRPAHGHGSYRHDRGSLCRSGHGPPGGPSVRPRHPARQRPWRDHRRARAGRGGQRVAVRPDRNDPSGLPPRRQAAEERLCLSCRWSGPGDPARPDRSHVHVMGLGLAALSLDLSDTHSLAEALDQIAPLPPPIPTARGSSGVAGTRKPGA
jgi:3-hydroxyisobutyrate dehydrogenase